MVAGFDSAWLEAVAPSEVICLARRKITV